MARRSATWKFELVVSKTMERLGEVRQARSKSLQLIHNRSGGLSFTVPMQYELFAEAEDIKHGILAYRNGVPKWSGMIWKLDEGVGNGRLGVNCVGWFETVNRRVLRQIVSYPRYTTPESVIKGGEVVFLDPHGVSTDLDYHPGGLLTIANAQQDTWITEGTNSDQMKRIVSYSQGQSIGAAITDLSDTEAGFDFTVDPLTRQMDIKNWDEYRDRRDRAVFGLNTPPYNLSDGGRSIDASTMVNRMTALGAYGGGLAEDLDSQEEFQLFEEYASLSDVVDPNVLLAYAGGEVVLRSNPRLIYSLVPFPWTKGKTPEPFVDYDLGDLISFSMVKKPRVSVKGQAARVFGMTLGIDEEGNERLDALQVVPGG